MKPKGSLPHLKDNLANVSAQKTGNYRETADNLAELIVKLGSDQSLSRFSALVEDLVRATVREFELPIRRLLAERLSRDNRVPQGIALILVDDSIEVAWPILTDSMVIDDAALIRIALAGSLQHRLAISQRVNVNSDVSTAVTAFGEVEVIEKLLENESSSVSEGTFKQIALVAHVNARLHGPLARRHDLPRLLALAMLEWVEVALHAFLAPRIGYSESELRAILRDAVRSRSVADILEARVQMIIDEVILRDTGPDAAELFLILESLPHSQRGLKELVIAIFLGEPLMSVRKASRAEKADGFAYLCRGADISSTVFGWLCEQVGPLDAITNFEKSGWILAAKRAFDNCGIHDAQRAFARWFEADGAANYTS